MSAIAEFLPNFQDVRGNELPSQKSAYFTLCKNDFWFLGFLRSEGIPITVVLFSPVDRKAWFCFCLPSGCRGSGFLSFCRHARKFHSAQNTAQKYPLLWNYFPGSKAFKWHKISGQISCLTPSNCWKFLSLKKFLHIPQLLNFSIFLVLIFKQRDKKNKVHGLERPKLEIVTVEWKFPHLVLQKNVWLCFTSHCSTAGRTTETCSIWAKGKTWHCGFYFFFLVASEAFPVFLFQGITTKNLSSCRFTLKLISWMKSLISNWGWRKQMNKGLLPFISESFLLAVDSKSLFGPLISKLFFQVNHKDRLTTMPPIINFACRETFAASGIGPESKSFGWKIRTAKTNHAKKKIDSAKCMNKNRFLHSLLCPQSTETTRHEISWCQESSIVSITIAQCLLTNNVFYVFRICKMSQSPFSPELNYWLWFFCLALGFSANKFSDLVCWRHRFGFIHRSWAKPKMVGRVSQTVHLKTLQFHWSPNAHMHQWACPTIWWWRSFLFAAKWNYREGICLWILIPLALYMYFSSLWARQKNFFSHSCFGPEMSSSFQNCFFPWVRVLFFFQIKCDPLVFVVRSVFSISLFGSW